MHMEQNKELEVISMRLDDIKDFIFLFSWFLRKEQDQ